MPLISTESQYDSYGDQSAAFSFVVNSFIFREYLKESEIFKKSLPNE